ncbi:MAG TPA: hypothetical protein EYN54_01375 [Methylococcaceae bacterium]|nr:hypothetical protein [Flavobacteriaceae bacterium]HHZ68947.1 hypothetical protein [Methylococcaceae bacterium]
MNEELKYGGPDEIPQVEATCSNDIFENGIRNMGVIAACEWFGHDVDSEFTKETRDVLCHRSGLIGFNQDNEEIPF